MKKIKKTVRLSVTLLLIVSMLLTPMSPIFAIPNEKTDDADLVANSATVEAEKNVPVLIDEEKMIYEIKGDAESREWIYATPDDILNGTTSGLLEYFLDSHFLHQDIYARSTIGANANKSDYTRHTAFKELVSRKDLLHTLESYAKKVFANISKDELLQTLEKDPKEVLVNNIDVRNLLSELEMFSKILEQDSVSVAFSNVSEKSLTDYPFLTNFYSESSVQSRAVGDLVGWLNNVPYYSAGVVYTVNNRSVDVYEAGYELTDDQIDDFIDYYALLGNTLLSNPTAYYNCHSYA